MEPKYEISPDVRNKIENIFTYHPLKDENQGERHAYVRQTIREATLKILEVTPASREQELFITQMQLAMMCANAAISINE